MKYCGIDYSYGCPAICFWDDTTPFKFQNLKFYAFYTVAKYCRQIAPNILIMKQPEYKNNEERFMNIARWAEAVILTEKPDLITLEGYAMGNSANSNNICQTAENTSLLKQALRRNNYDFEIISPSAVKKIFCDVGNAKKPQMIEFFEANFKVNMRAIMDNLDAKDPKPIDDLVDSLAILVSGSEFQENNPGYKMKSMFIARVSEIVLKQGLTSPEAIFEVIKPEYDKKGSVVTLSNVKSALNCVENNWYLGDNKEVKTDDQSTD